jgi:Putative MetA-pathway of phenol degradation
MSKVVLKCLVTIISGLLLFPVLIGLNAAWAGPPFVTDDPEPVEYRHGEFYIAGQYANNKGGYEGVAPLLELNYGPLPDVHIHMIVPLAYVHEQGGLTNYGPGDLELGVKYRLIHETEMIPQVGTFLITTIPTGDSDRGLGSGHVPLFLPLWVQKSRGPWTAYGGGGLWINPGAGNKNFWQTGGVVQREITKTLTVGAELFHFTRKEDLGRDRTGFNAGAIINLTDDYHLLLSAGRDIDGDNRFSSYAAFQWTFGTHEEKK